MKKILTSLALGVFLVILVAPAIAQEQGAMEGTTAVQLQNDGNKLFEQDPSPGGDDGGSSCRTCLFKFGSRTLSCAAVTDGDGASQCKITLNGNIIECEVFGTFCSVITVHG